MALLTIFPLFTETLRVGLPARDDYQPFLRKESQNNILYDMITWDHIYFFISLGTTSSFLDAVASQVLATVTHWQVHSLNKIQASSLSVACIDLVSQHDAIQSNVKYENVRETWAFLPRLIGIWPCFYLEIRFPRRDASGQYSGYYVDLAHTVARTAGFHPKLIVNTPSYDDLGQLL